MSEERSMQEPPDDPAELADHVRHRLRAGEQVWRCHRAHNGAWYFCSDGGCRFDLPGPQGTCYVAPRRLTAVLEVIEPVGKLVHIDELRIRKIAHLDLVEDYDLADTAHATAWSYGITRELGADANYTTPKRWARQFHAAGFQGLRYWARHDLSSHGLSYALFGTAGPRSWPTRPSEEIDQGVIDDLESEAGFTVVDTPRADELDIDLPDT